MKRVVDDFEPISDRDWPHLYLKVIDDKRFTVFGLDIRNLLDISFHLKCWNKTPEDLKKDVPR